MRSSRLHAGGRLSFRRRVRGPIAAAIPFVDGTENPPPWAELVPAGAARVEVEVGPGKGTFLLAAATARPDVFFLGVEAAPSYARYAADRLARAGATNGLLLCDNARVFLEDRVPPAAVDAFHVYYPDPWPKRRHRRRRFFGPGAAEALARGLKDAGLLFVATDSTAYFGEIVTLLGGCPALARDRALEERLGPGVGGEAFQPTNFERKYADRGRTLNRGAWRRVTGIQVELLPRPNVGRRGRRADQEVTD
jgi:tRNA (guanine-N7-)-methyltransferase